MGGVTNFKLTIDGKVRTEPKEGADIKYMAAFGSNSNQPQIESDRFTLVKDAAQAVIDNVAAGGIFEGQDAVIEYTQRNLTEKMFDGFIDTSDNYEEVFPSFGATERPNEVKVKFRGKNTITNFQDQIEGVTYGYMFEIGAIKNSDFVTVKTAVVKKTNFLEVAMSLVTLYIITKQIADNVKDIKDAASVLISTATGGVSGAAAAVILAVAQAIITLAYYTVLFALVIKLTLELIQLLIPPIVKNKGCALRVLLSRVCEHYGYTFVSPLTDLDLFVYLPTKPFSNEKSLFQKLIPLHVPTKIGIPSTSDYGYVIPEMFELCKRMFDAKIDVIGNEVHLRNKQDPFWLSTSEFKPHKSINFPSKKYNTRDLRQTRLDSFVVDIADPWTIENYTGTSYEIKTEPTNINNIKNVVIKGLERTDYPVALPNAKTKLSIVESAMIGVAAIADALAKSVGRKGNMANGIRRNRINVLKVDNMDYSVPKLVPLINGQLPPNHRDLLSAKVLNQKYHQGKSFVTGEKLGQKVFYENISIPFTLDDFKKTLKSGKFILDDGRVAEFMEINYQLSKDIAEVSISIQEIYTDKLKEVTIEP